MKTVHLLAVSVLVCAPAWADEGRVALKEAPGKDKVLGNCVTCHSLDYVQTNSPFPDRKMWEAEVAKMRNAFKARISEDDAKAVVDYLVANYGTSPDKGK